MQKSMKSRPNQASIHGSAGLTLVEVLIVIVNIAEIAAILVPPSTP